ncbi:MAG TPA: ABC transporter transmembrane domain-containing protein, partial [Candidatus Limnocylindrales bacterium]|nr:ABC transporter transmembrane domain-containing protein [Candidatus Limnocylindrales bacterium]
MAVTFIQSKRDREISRHIHRLFWRANWIDKTGLISGYMSRIIAFAAYHVAIPLVSAYAIQAIIERRPDRVNQYIFWLLALSLVYCVFFTLGQLMISRNAIKSLRYIQEAVFKNFLNKDYEFYNNAYIGTLGAQAARLRDAANGYGEIVIMLVPKQATIIIASVAVIASQSLLLAIITFIAMFLVLVFTFASSSWRLKFRRQVSEASSTVAGQIGDALTHAAAVKSFASETYEEKRVERSLEPWGRAQYRSWMAAVPADNGRLMLAAITTAVLLIISARLYENGALSITIIVLIQLYVIKLIAATLDIADIVKRYEEVMGAAYEPM